ncbi:hypothetical protein KKE26_05115 [bacterium]|nr:hypothetical protein [bacterium]MBU1754093.1 hypothetical protein [bacterium]
METATTRGEHLWQVAVTSFPRIIVAAGLVPALTILTPDIVTLFVTTQVYRIQESEFRIAQE